MNADSETEDVYPRPLSGAQVTVLPPALLPARETLRGQYVELVPMNLAAHGADLYEASHGAMDDLGYRRMQWRCNAQNQRSRGAAKRLGFRFEGIFYNHLTYKGKNRDTAWYSILDVEWPELRGIFESWLAAENFSADGIAKRSLSELMSGRREGVEREPRA